MWLCVGVSNSQRNPRPANQRAGRSILTNSKVLELPGTSLPCVVSSYNPAAAAMASLRVGRKSLLPISIVVLSLLACIAFGQGFISSFGRPPSLIEVCWDRTGTYTHDGADLEGYRRCARDRADIFLKADYSETKDLCKAFLTLLTAVFVASITFSEKIVNVGRSGWWPKSMMITSWICLLLAIAACGAGLSLMTWAAGYATHNWEYDVYELEGRAVPLFIYAGLLFGGGLAALLVAGIISLVDSHRTLGGQETGSQRTHFE